MGPKPTPVTTVAIAGMNPERAALLSGTDKAKFDKEFDIAAKRMAQEPRSKPSERIRTGEELVEYNAEKLRKAQRKVQGLPENNDEEDALIDNLTDEGEDEDFGFGSGIQPQQPTESTELGVEDEDEFIIDDDLVSNGSGVDLSDAVLSEDESGSELDEGDADFLNSLEEESPPGFLTGANRALPEGRPEKNGVNTKLANISKCPESHEELIEATTGMTYLALPTFVSIKPPSSERLTTCGTRVHC
jgi:nucleolar protein 14